MKNYQFTNAWFQSAAQKNWDTLIPQFIKPSTILEVGSYEGASACYLIEKLAPHNPIEIHCVDTWEGGVEHQTGGLAEANMQSVESRFLHNTQSAIQQSAHHVDLHIHKGYSDMCMAQLLSQGKQGYFDFVYIDGSHQAPDVLCDAVLGFKLLKTGGVMVFDDYLWLEELATGRDILRCPKPAIDAFVNLYFRKINVIPMPLYQMYVQKISD
jgi:predicted O-methyltransferase YrrM